MSVAFVYVTTGNPDEAAILGRAVVGERLAACANVLPSITSIYRWEGKLEEAGETALILKTRVELIEPLTARIKALHSYECPCIVALPVAGGNPAFLEWICAETA
jgi:periplasmic divalent cation tolerance protein